MTNPDDGWAKIYDKRDLDHCVKIGISMGVQRVIELLEQTEAHDLIFTGDETTFLDQYVHNPLCSLCNRIEQIRTIGNETVHGAPPTKSGLTPCCGKDPADLSALDRLTKDPFLITCEGVFK